MFFIGLISNDWKINVLKNSLNGYKKKSSEKELETDMKFMPENCNRTQKTELKRNIFPHFISVLFFIFFFFWLKQLLKETKIIVSDDLLHILCLKCSKGKDSWFPFEWFGFYGTGKKDDSQQEGERQEETTNPIKVTSFRMEPDQWIM